MRKGYCNKIEKIPLYQGTIPKYNMKIVERGKINITKTQIHDCLHFCLGTGTSLKKWWV